MNDEQFEVAETRPSQNIMASKIATNQVNLVKTYFRRMDSGDFAAELFTKQFQFYFPKYGVGSGPNEFQALAEGLRATIRRLIHHIEDFVFIETDNIVVVEGTTEGESISGRPWRGGKTPGGRFCSVFAFDTHGLIERMHIYLDPDYLSEDTLRFFWNRGDSQRW